MIVPLPSFRPLIVIPARLALDAAAGQAAGRHRRRADDRPCLAPRRGGRDRAGARRLRRGRDRGGGRAGGRAGGADPARPSLGLRPHPRGGERRSIPSAATTWSSTCRATCRTIDPAAIRAVLSPLADPAVDIATLAAPIRDAEERRRPNVVKVALRLRARRSASPARSISAACRCRWGEGEHYHHIGIYAYRRAALERFVALPPAPLERRERLEQLRALEAGMRIDVALVDTGSVRCRYSRRPCAGPRARG